MFLYPSEKPTMSALYPSKDDTLTARNIVDAYVSAYKEVNRMAPECYALDSRWFVVEGQMRDRRWMVLEVERLRQEALTAVLDNNENQSRGNILRMIRRLSRL
jgi:hypothetical protein